MDFVWVENTEHEVIFITKDNGTSRTRITTNLKTPVEIIKGKRQGLIFQFDSRKRTQYSKTIPWGYVE